ncbi:MAG: 1-acyl-sn-glycerol-3-phosphate acyltransferase [Acidimicrobiia bacterium]|nr:1-acyl-sn-glycerol-3-phosphate acyltransferase [Acidimicrobiia bacterium]
MSRRDRFIKKIVSWAIALLYHRVEVRQRPGLTETGPQLANGSHFGGFSDPLVLVYAMDRVPRFIGRDVIWKNPIARVIVNWVGAIPVHKPEDGTGKSSNDQMFASTYDALDQGELVTIFPEGITVDDPSIASIKTGSARIALGARANGVEGIQIISAGIHYENKAALRSDVFIDIGWEIDLDAEIDNYVAQGEIADASNHAAVRKLTDDMEVRLRRAAPDFEDWTTAHSLSAAAAVALRDPETRDTEVGHGDRERLAGLLDDADEEAQTAVEDAMTTYQADLDAMGLDDAMFISGMSNASTFSWYIIRTLFIGLLLLPFALVGVVVNWLPMLVVWLIGRLKVADAAMATIKPLAGLFVFLLTWSAWAWWGWSQRGAEGLAIIVLLLPVYLFALIALTERFVLFFRSVRGFARSRSIQGVHQQMTIHRRAVVEAVAQAL